jgi:glycine cleavage system transcriptional repressor
MHRSFVLTLTGTDRIGIVDTVTKRLLDHGGNVETSRMARLGGEFAILMLVSMPADRFDDLTAALASLAAQGYKLTTTPTEHTYAEAHPGWQPYRIEVEGADHEGIIHEVAHYLSGRGISIESADTETTLAPVSGVPLFTMTALVVVPPHPAAEAWEAGLQAIAHRANLEIQVTAVPKP